MIAWAIGRGVSRLVRACGGSSEDAAMASMCAGFALSWLDLPGTMINTVHSVAQLKAADGSKVGKAVDIGMSVLILGGAAGDLADARGLLKDSSSSLAAAEIPVLPEGYGDS